MPSPSNKKLLILYILEVLKKYSSERRPLTREQICARIYADYGVESERKAISKNLESLSDFGYDIVEVPRRGVYLTGDFTEGELRFLIDSVLYSGQIIDKYAGDLVSKLQQLGSGDARSRLGGARALSVSSQASPEIFLALEVFADAIQNDKKVSFIENEYGKDKKLHPKADTPTVVDPYELSCISGRHCLLGSADGGQTVSRFPLDKLTSPKKLDENRSANSRYMTLIADLRAEEAELNEAAAVKTGTADDGTEELRLIDVDFSCAQDVLDKISLDFDRREKMSVQVAVFDNNKLSDFSFLTSEPFAQLFDLTVANNPLEDLASVAKIKSLQRLELCHTGVRRLAPLKACKDLRALCLYESEIEDWEVLFDLPRLELLALTDSEAYCFELNRLQRKKPWLNVRIERKENLHAASQIDYVEGLDRRAENKFYPCSVLANIYGIRISTDAARAARDGIQGSPAARRTIEKTIRVALRYVDPEWRQVFYLYYRDGLSLWEIACKMRLPVGLVQRILNIVMRRLRHPSSSRIFKRTCGAYLDALEPPPPPGEPIWKDEQE